MLSKVEYFECFFIYVNVIDEVFVDEEKCSGVFLLFMVGKFLELFFILEILELFGVGGMGVVYKV